jgi:hypothetical protein
MSSRSLRGELPEVLSEPVVDEVEDIALFLFRVRDDFVIRSSLSGRFLRGLPRLTVFLTTPSKAPMHIPR